MQCAIDGCGRPEKKAGLCWGHHKLKSKNKEISVELKMQHASRGNHKLTRFELLARAGEAYQSADVSDDRAYQRARRNYANAARRFCRR